ncbi:MAG: PSD1 domain-containing protein, partial [Planctomycetes bacterium]|nr:PSD1 domain-containing protein [Planctomycetota bacterium]
MVSSADDKIPAADAEFFESSIRPVLVKHCYQCHSTSAGVAESDLKLDSREATRTGGTRGPAVVAGKPNDSLLLTAISHADPDLQMPPRVERLPKAVVADFRRWIERGALDPRDKADAAPIRVAADQSWALQPLARSKVPMSDSNWPRSELDYFILQQLTDHQLKPSNDANPQTLLRRLFFDITGLPPKPTEIKAFQKAVAKQGIEVALAQQVDSLLESPGYGVRWGRHWLDVARFAESSGKEANISFPYAWRYRDYVIDAFNADIPFDRFVTEQIAGDLLPADDDEERTRLLIATGFLAVGTKNLDAMDPRQFAADVVDEQIDAVSRVFMASSIACARCHDHKFDPYSMNDYYALAGIFASTKTYFGTAVSPSNRVGGDPLVLPKSATTPILHKSIPKERVEKLKEERKALQGLRAEKGAEFTLRDALRVFWRTGAIDGQLEKVDAEGRALPLAMGVLESEKIGDAPLLGRGEVNRVGDRVPRGFPDAILASAQIGKAQIGKAQIGKAQSGRQELAQWLTHRDHPLTARVTVNRIWSHLFGAGLVASVDDFGSTGQKPSFTELLDPVAARFIEQGWSQKQLLPALLLSRTHRQASHHQPT